jgi:hypothetical protein
MSALCDKARRLLAHYERLEDRAVGPLGAPLSDAELDAAERKIGRLLPEDVRDLFLCMNGSHVFAPSVEFRPIDMALKRWRVGVDRDLLPILSNAPGWVEPEEFFPVLDMDVPQFSVLTTVGVRRRTSPVLLVDLLGDQLTVVAYTLEALVDWFLDGFERGDVKVTEHGVFWTTDRILAFPPGHGAFGNTDR